MKWKIYYLKGVVFSSEQGTHQTAPPRGIQVIIQDHPDHISEIVTGDDFYVFWNGRWQGLAHIYDIWDYAIETGLLPEDSPPSAIHKHMDEWVERGLIKFGRMITQEQYTEIMRQVDIDKTGWMPWERKP